MNLWTALVILQLSSNPVPLVNAIPDGPLHLDVGPTLPENPAVDLNVKAPEGTRVDRIIGVQAETYVNMPASVLLGFASRELCDAASKVLAKQSGVLSVSCVQTETPK